MSKSVQASNDLLIVFRCLNSTLAGKNPVYHRFVSLRFQGKDFGRIQLLETSIRRFDKRTTTDKKANYDYSNLFCCKTTFNSLFIL